MVSKIVRLSYSQYSNQLFHELDPSFIENREKWTKIGSGSFGCVYRSTIELTDGSAIPIAIKALDTEIPNENGDINDPADVRKELALLTSFFFYSYLLLLFYILIIIVIHEFNDFSIIDIIIIIIIIIINIIINIIIIIICYSYYIISIIMKRGINKVKKGI